MVSYIETIVPITPVASAAPIRSLLNYGIPLVLFR
jgi:hypothetical protein